MDRRSKGMAFMDMSGSTPVFNILAQNLVTGVDETTLEGSQWLKVDVVTVRQAKVAHAVSRRTLATSRDIAPTQGVVSKGVGTGLPKLAWCELMLGCSV